MSGKHPRYGFLRTRAAGFTLVELAVLIVIIGVMAGMAVPRYFDSRPFAARGYFDEVAAALKLSQRLAVASGCPVRFELAAGSYNARQQQPVDGRCDRSDTSWSTPVATADGEFLAGTAPLGVSATPAVTLTFDGLGRPDLNSDQPITIGGYALLVRAGSGYVEMP